MTYKRVGALTSLLFYVGGSLASRAFAKRSLKRSAGGYLVKAIWVSFLLRAAITTWRMAPVTASGLSFWM